MNCSSRLWLLETLELIKCLMLLLDDWGLVRVLLITRKLVLWRELLIVLVSRILLLIKRLINRDWLLLRWILILVYLILLGVVLVILVRVVLLLLVELLTSIHELVFQWLSWLDVSRLDICWLLN